MNGINKVIIVGTLGRDPELRYMSTGDAVANLSVATSESWKDKSGNKNEKTEWHRIVIFGKLAEVAGQYLSKGSKAYFEGKLQTRKWQDESGTDRYATEIVAFQMQMLGDKTEQQNTKKSSNKNNKQHKQTTIDDYDDIPF